MKEAKPEKALYTEAEFDAAMSGNAERQGIEEAKSIKEKVEDLAEMPLDGDDTLREGDTFVSESSEGPVENIGFSDSDLRNMDAITLMRIYDLLGAILTHLDETTATAILEAHADGKLIGPFPYLNI